MTSNPPSNAVGSTAGGSAAAAWPDGELNRLAAAEEIQVSTRRGDGTLRGFVPIWIVAVDGNLYVRSSGAATEPGTGTPPGRRDPGRRAPGRHHLHPGRLAAAKADRGRR